MKRRHRDNLAGEHRLGDIGQLIFFCFFMALWISAHLLRKQYKVQFRHIGDIWMENDHPPSKQERTDASVLFEMPC